MGSKEDFAKRLQAAFLRNKSGSPEAPTEVGSLEDLLNLLQGGGKTGDKKPTDETPVSDGLIAGAISMLADLTNINKPLDEYVRAYVAAMAVHYQIHKAPIYMVKIHEHSVALAQAIEAIATIRFGLDTFDKAVQEVMNGHSDAINAATTDTAIEAGPDHFKALRPKNRAN